MFVYFEWCKFVLFSVATMSDEEEYEEEEEVEESEAAEAPAPAAEPEAPAEEEYVCHSICLLVYL